MAARVRAAAAAIRYARHTLTGTPYHGSQNVTKSAVRRAYAAQAMRARGAREHGALEYCIRYNSVYTCLRVVMASRKARRARCVIRHARALLSGAG